MDFGAVVPRKGTWIEMLLTLEPNTLAPGRPPQGDVDRNECDPDEVMTEKVVPRKGTWIEILRVEQGNSTLVQSSPARGRG